MTKTTTKPGPPRWAPDPEGRFDVRWFDGASWTHHVAIQGALGSSPPGLAEADSKMVATQLIDTLPVARPALPSAWGEVPPPPHHMPSLSAPPTQGWQPDLAHARALNPEERAEAIHQAQLDHRRLRATLRCPMHWRLAASLLTSSIMSAAAGLAVLLLLVMDRAGASTIEAAAVAGVAPFLYVAWAFVVSLDGHSTGQKLLGIHYVDVLSGKRIGWFRYVIWRRLFPAVLLAGAWLGTRQFYDGPMWIVAAGVATGLVVALLAPWLSRRNQTVRDMVSGIMLERPPAV